MDYSDPYPADSEQFFLIEELYKSTDLQQKRIDDMLHNKVNNEALEKAVSEEEYEIAARLRDRIKQLEKKSAPQ